MFYHAAHTDSYTYETVFRSSRFLDLTQILKYTAKKKRFSDNLFVSSIMAVTVSRHRYVVRKNSESFAQKTSTTGCTTNKSFDIKSVEHSFWKMMQVSFCQKPSSSAVCLNIVLSEHDSNWRQFEDVIKENLNDEVPQKKEIVAQNIFQ